MKKLFFALMMALPVAAMAAQYAVVRPDGVTEIRQDNTPPANAIYVTPAQYDGLKSGALMVQSGVVVTNPNPPRF